MSPRGDNAGTPGNGEDNRPGQDARPPSSRPNLTPPTNHVRPKPAHHATQNRPQQSPHPKSRPTGAPKVPAPSRLPENLDSRLHDWQIWLNLSTTPDVTSWHEALTVLHLCGGAIPSPDRWPAGPAARVYVAFDDIGAVYVGQTTKPLLIRVRKHFGNQRTAEQRRKAGTWQLVATAAFTGLELGDLDRLERSAARWLLPLPHRKGRRHPDPRAFGES